MMDERWTMMQKFLIRYKGGAKGLIWASHSVVGYDNNMGFIISGSKGTLEWAQERSNELNVYMQDGPTKVYTRGNGYFYPEVDDEVRLPSGHVEGHYIAFANIYRAFNKDVRALKNNEPLSKGYPQIEAGINGIVFVEKCVKSNNADSSWVSFDD